MLTRSPQDRIRAHVLIQDDGCWLWKGKTNHGYGVIKAYSREHRAHRFSYEAFVGPIPEGLQLDHLCRVRHCVNPAHLEPVTLRENLARGTHPMVTALRTDHCIHGHPFDEANTYIRKGGARSCRACSRIKTARYYAARRKKGATA